MIDRVLSAGAKTTARNALAFAAGPMCAALSAPLIARALGPEGRGQLAAVLVPLTFADAIAAFGMPAALTYFRARGVPNGSLVRLALPELIFAATVSYLALFAFSAKVAEQSGQAVVFLRCIWLVVAAGIAIAVVRALREGEHAWNKLNLDRVIAPVVRTVACLLLFLSESGSVQLFASVYLLSGVISSLILLRWRRVGQCSCIQTPFIPTRRALSSYSVRAFTSTVANVITTRADQLYMAAVLLPRDLGLYVVAVTIAELPSILHKAVSQLVFVKVAAGYDVRLAMNVARLTMSVTTIIAIGLFAISSPTIRFVFGSSFLATIPVLAVLLGSSVFAAGATVLGFVLNGLARPGSTSSTDVAAMVLTMVLLLALVPRFGMIGAAVSAGCVQAACFFARWIILCRMYEIPVASLVKLSQQDLRLIRAIFRSSTEGPSIDS